MRAGRSPARSGSARCRAGAGCAGRCRGRPGCGPRAGPPAVTQFEVGELAALVLVAKQVSRRPSSVGEPQLGAGVRPFLADDQPHALRPAGRGMSPVSLGDPGAVADLCRRRRGRCPGRRRDLQHGLVDGVGDGHADRVRQPPAPAGRASRGSRGCRRRSRCGSASAVPAGSCLRQLGQGQLGGGDVIGSRCWSPRCRAAAGRPPAPRSRPGRGRRTRRAGDGRRSSSRSRWRPACRSARAPAPRRCPRSPARRRPGPSSPANSQTRDAYFGPRRPDRGERLRSGGGEGVDEPGDRRVGGHRPEHGRLGPQHGDIREAVPAQRDRRARHPAGSCPDRAPPAACATAPAPPISRCPDRPCGPSRPAAPPRPARPPRGRRPRRGHAGTTRYASSPGEVLLSVQRTGP